MAGMKVELRVGNAPSSMDVEPHSTISQLLDMVAQQSGVTLDQLKLTCKSNNPAAEHNAPSTKLDSAESISALKSLLRRTGKLEQMGVHASSECGSASGGGGADSQDKINKLEKSNSDLEKKLKAALAEADKLKQAHALLTRQHSESGDAQAQLDALRIEHDRLKADLAGAIQMREALEGQMGSSVVEIDSNTQIPPGCHDYDVDDEGVPQAVTHPGTFRLCGHGFLDYGFQLTGNPDIATLPQQGHFLCRVQFELDALSSELFLKFDYHMHGTDGGEGLCAYLLDPFVPGWCVTQSPLSFPLRCVQGH